MPLSHPDLYQFKQAITDDIRQLRAGAFKTKDNRNWSTSYRSCVDKSVWIYEPGAHVLCSAADYLSFKVVIGCRMNTVTTNRCPLSDHYMLEPFLSDNKSLQASYEQQLMVASQEEEELFYQQQLEKLRAAFQLDSVTDTPFHTPGVPALKGIQFDEDDWSLRLYHALHDFLPRGYKDSLSYTAKDALRFKIKQELVTGLPSERAACYLFHGATDIIIKNKHTIYFDSSSLEYDSSRSEEEAIEVKQQADVQSHKYPPKLGELIAGLHVIVTKKSLKTLLKEDNCEKFMQKTEITSHGLYINKLLGGICCTLTIPIMEVASLRSERTCMFVDDYHYTHLTTGTLCGLIKRVLDL